LSHASGSLNSKAVLDKSELLSEGVLLAFLGAALGSVLAQVLSRFLVLFMSRSSETLFLQLSPDWRLLGEE
jgi:putative ABC transport system permease protein